MNVRPRAESLPVLMGVASQQIGTRSINDSGTISEDIALRLSSLNEPRITKDAERIFRCVDDPFDWRCGITTLCASCGRRKAIKEGRSIEREVLNTAYVRAIVTRTVRTETIEHGHRILKHARQMQNRTVRWTELVVYSRGRIEVKRTRDNDAWLVHGHEIALLRPEVEIARRSLKATWTRLLGREGCVGSFDLRVIDEESAVSRDGKFRSTESVRDEEEAPRAFGVRRRRAPGMGDQHAWAAMRPAVGCAPEMNNNANVQVTT